MHPKYWKPARIMAPLDSEGSAGGGETSLVDAFADVFEGAADDDNKSAPVAESQDDAAARLAAEDAAKASENERIEAKQDDQQAPEQGPQKFTVKVDGKDVELTADEMAEHVKNGMRQSDYTKKTMELAEQRKAVETETAKARSQREEYAGKLEQFAGQANYELNALASQLTPDLLQSDPMQYLLIQRTVQERQAQLAQAQGELQKINEQRSTEKAEADRLSAQDQQEKLLAKIPEWKDQAKAKAELTQLNEYLAQQGYANDGDSLPQYLQIALARKAMQYDALMARAKTTQANVAKAPPKVERPSVPVPATDGRSSAMQKLARTGSRDAAAEVFAEMFG